MFPNYFKYPRKDLRKKFRQMVETNKMISDKSNQQSKLPAMKIVDFPFLEDNQNELNNSIFTDIKDLSSTNISAIMRQPEEDLINYFMKPFEGGYQKIQNFQNLLAFKKRGDQFYSYKKKIYEVN